MIRSSLPVIICLFPHFGAAQTAQTCETRPGSLSNCVRVLACIGDGGLYLDGEARGWDQGTLEVTRSDGVRCTGRWNSDGPLGTGVAELTCEDGLTGGVVYYNQDNETGTVIGQGQDSLGRQIEAWSGLNVLQFLSESGKPQEARLPCSPAPLFLS